MEADSPLTMLIRGPRSRPKEYCREFRPCMYHHARSIWKRLRDGTSSCQRFFGSFAVEDAQAQACLSHTRHSSEDFCEGK